MTDFPFDPSVLRAQFPALRRTVDGQPAVFLDGPGGTQSPDRVIEALAGYLRRGSSNLGGPFLTSREADATVDAARAWTAEVDLFADVTLLGRTDSWYMAANVPGKRRQLLNHPVTEQYRQHLADSAAAGYPGFVVS